MKVALITLAIFSSISVASAEEKTALAETGEAMKSIIEVPAKYLEKSIIQDIVDGKGSLAEGARKTLRCRSNEKGRPTEAYAEP